MPESSAIGGRPASSPIMRLRIRRARSRHLRWEPRSNERSDKRASSTLNFIRGREESRPPVPNSNRLATSLLRRRNAEPDTLQVGLSEMATPKDVVRISGGMDASRTRCPAIPKAGKGRIRDGSSQATAARGNRIKAWYPVPTFATRTSNFIETHLPRRVQSDAKPAPAYAVCLDPPACLAPARTRLPIFGPATAGHPVPDPSLVSRAYYGEPLVADDRGEGPASRVERRGTGRSQGSSARRARRMRAHT